MRIFKWRYFSLYKVFLKLVSNLMWISMFYYFVLSDLSESVWGGFPKTLDQAVIFVFGLLLSVILVNNNLIWFCNSSGLWQVCRAVKSLYWMYNSWCKIHKHLSVGWKWLRKIFFFEHMCNSIGKQQEHQRLLSGIFRSQLWAQCDISGKIWHLLHLILKI